MATAKYLALIVVTLLNPAFISAGSADTVFFYSDPDEQYGWAAGYGSSRAERDAREACRARGSQCQLVLQCGGGWSAVAFADNSATAVAFSCGYGNATSARVAALQSCVAKAKALCWTNATISNNGKARSDKNNRDFDMTWYAQGLLQHLKIPAAPTMTGTMDEKTRAALKYVRTKLGLQPNGQLDETLFNILVGATSRRRFVQNIDAIFQDQSAKYSDSIADHIYARGRRPNTLVDFGDAIAARTDTERRTALATLISLNREPCTLPAKRAEPLPSVAGSWWVTCDEREWTVSVSDTLILTTPGRINITSGKQGPSAADKPSSQDAASPGILPAPSSRKPEFH